MKLPSHPLLRFASFCALAYLSVDLVLAIRSFWGGPTVPVLPAAQSTRSASINPQWPGELQWMLSVRSQSEVPPTLKQPPAGDAVVAPEQLPAPRLLATLQGSGQRLALLQFASDSQVLGVQEMWKDFLVLEVDDFSVRLRDKTGRELVVTMAMAGRPGGQPVPDYGVATEPSVSKPVVSPVKSLSLKRQQIQQWFSEKEAVAGSAVGPYKRNEQVVGMQVNYITPESPYAKLGIKSGDAIVALNGRAVLTPTDMKWCQQEIVTASRLDFQLEHDGQTLPHQVQVQP